jgi:hypothetical protein
MSKIILHIVFSCDDLKRVRVGQGCLEAPKHWNNLWQILRWHFCSNKRKKQTKRCSHILIRASSVGIKSYIKNPDDLCAMKKELLDCCHALVTTKIWNSSRQPSAFVWWPPLWMWNNPSLREIFSCPAQRSKRPFCHFKVQKLNLITFDICDSHWSSFPLKLKKESSSTKKLLSKFVFQWKLVELAIQHQLPHVYDCL